MSPSQDHRGWQPGRRNRWWALYLAHPFFNLLKLLLLVTALRKPYVGKTSKGLLAYPRPVITSMVKNAHALGYRLGTRSCSSSPEA